MRYGPRGGHGRGLVVHRDKACERLDLLVCELGDVMGSQYHRIVVSKYVHGCPDRETAERERWSDREIARRCGVEHHLVGKVRISLGSDPSDKNPPRIYTTKHGAQSTMKTNSIGQREAAPRVDLLAG